MPFLQEARRQPGRDTGLPKTLKGSSAAFATENSPLSSQQSWQLLQHPHQPRLDRLPWENGGPPQFKIPFWSHFLRNLGFSTVINTQKPQARCLTDNWGQSRKGHTSGCSDPKFRGPKRIKAWCRLLFRVGSPGKDLGWSGARGIVGNLAKGYPKILSRHTAGFLFSYSKEKAIIYHFPAYEGIDQSRHSFKGLLWWYDIMEKKTVPKYVPTTRTSQSIFKTFPPSLHTVSTQYETWNLEQCIWKLRPTRFAR